MKLQRNTSIYKITQVTLITKKVGKKEHIKSNLWMEM